MQVVISFLALNKGYVSRIESELNPTLSYVLEAILKIIMI